MRLRLPGFVRVHIFEGEPSSDTLIFGGTGKEYYKWISNIEPFLGKRNITVRIRCIGLKSYEGTYNVSHNSFPQYFDLFLDNIVDTNNEKALTLRLIFAGVIES